MKVVTKHNAPLLSVIIPVYGTESTLRRCVESVTCDKNDALEVILVDDGSPDAAGVLCDELATEDSRIRVLHQQNQGPSVARNAGLDVARGKYIAFLDSDDYWLPGVVNELLADCATEVDLIRYRCRYHGTRPDEERILDSFRSGLLASDEIKRLNMLVLRGKIPIFVPLIVVSRSIIGDLRFSEGVVFEDLELYSRLSSRLSQVKIRALELYSYEDNPDSLMRSTSRLESTIRDLFSVSEQVLLNISSSSYWTNEEVRSVISARAGFCYRFVFHRLRTSSVSCSQMREVLAFVRNDAGCKRLARLARRDHDPRSVLARMVVLRMPAWMALRLLRVWKAAS